MKDDSNDAKKRDSSEVDISEALMNQSFGSLPDALASCDPIKTQILSQADRDSIQEYLSGHFEEEAAVKWSVKRVAPSPGDPDRPPSISFLGEKDYILHQMIGSGGFGEVWEAIQTSLGRTIALKYLRKDLFETGREDKTRGKALDMSFRQEALATANLEHPNIVPIHEVGVDQEGRPLIAMKRIGGRCWQEILDVDFSVLPYNKYLVKHLAVLIDVCQAVAFAHSRGIVHRDIKPSQVMVGEFGEVVLMDWGLAIMFDSELFEQHAPGSLDKDIPTLATASNPAGTLAFMAPEQTEKSAEKIGAHTDIYLLGGLLYYILTGKTPHDPDSVSQAFNQARNGIIRPMLDSPYGDEIPPSLVFLATQAMAPDPEDRIASARDFITEIENYLTGAGKREESRYIGNSVLEQLNESNLEYAELSDLLSQIAQARILDPENDAAIEAEQILRLRYAERALKNQDYVLARIQALRLDEDNKRSHYLEKANQGERRIQKQNYYQRLISLLLSLVLVWAGTTFYFVNSDMEVLNQVNRDYLKAREGYMVQYKELFQVIPLEIRLNELPQDEILVNAGGAWSEFTRALLDLLDYATSEALISDARQEKTQLARVVESQLHFFESVYLPDGIQEPEDLAVFNQPAFESFRAELDQTMPEFLSLTTREILLKWQSRANVVRITSLTFAFLAFLMIVYFVLTYVVRRKNLYLASNN